MPSLNFFQYIATEINVKVAATTSPVRNVAAHLLHCCMPLNTAVKLSCPASHWQKTVPDRHCPVQLKKKCETTVVNISTCQLACDDLDLIRASIYAKCITPQELELDGN